MTNIKSGAISEDKDAEEAIRKAMNSLRNNQILAAANKFKKGLHKDETDTDVGKFTTRSLFHISIVVYGN